MAVTPGGTAPRPACFSWELIDAVSGRPGAGPCGVSRSRPGAQRALSEALLDATPGTVGELWQVRPSRSRAAVFVYEGLVARAEHDARTRRVVWS
ncbi:hypothetical protein [Actinomadura parmotrematis]|uniref:Uncharacterized protein n=1 Tax=Actinomadura parmotrematis TaxID=2864039 RepID=A0ABS7G477_9ACTN|nr:hypothetical protein [Actinomadura parmotrematis]MBW8487165.1 hypothetical protein [Actinomadura parmotrematis]